MPSPQLENGYITIAIEFFDNLRVMHLSGNEWIVLLFIMRKTWGWHKKSDRISLTQFTKDTKLNRSTVNKNIKSLVAKQILVAKQQPVGNIYQIQKDYSQWVTSCKNDTSCRFDTRVVAKLTKLVAKQQHTKDTNTKDTIQKIERVALHDLNDLHFKPIAQRYSVPIEFVRSKYDDMVNWAESNGKQKKDWIATLRNWVKKDAVQIRKEHHAKSKIANLGL